MELIGFQILLSKITPLYILILLGYIAGKCLDIDKKTIALLVFYLIVPIIFFNYAISIEIKPLYFLLPLITFLSAIFLSLSFWKLGKKLWPNSKFANVIAFSAGTGNTGYFGLPIAMILFEDNMVALYMLANIGYSFYEYTLGAYFFAMSEYSKKESVRQVIRLPMLYAFALGLILNILNFHIPDELLIVIDAVKGAYITLGIMFIGLGISAIKHFKINWKFTSVFLGAKYIAAPLLMITITTLDRLTLDIFSQDIRHALLLLSFVPPAANTVIFAQIYNCKPEEVSAATLIGFIIALLYLPIAVCLFFGECI